MNKKHMQKLLVGIAATATFSLGSNILADENIPTADNSPIEAPTPAKVVESPSTSSGNTTPAADNTVPPVSNPNPTPPSSSVEPPQTGPKPTEGVTVPEAPPSKPGQSVPETPSSSNSSTTSQTTPKTEHTAPSLNDKKDNSLHIDDKNDKNEHGHHVETPQYNYVTQPIITPSVQAPVKTQTGYQVVGTDVPHNQVTIQEADGKLKTVPISQIGGIINKDKTITVKGDDGKMKRLPQTPASDNLWLTAIGTILGWLGIKYIGRFDNKVKLERLV